MRTFLHIEDASDCGSEGLYDGEQDEDTDVVAEHPEHEDRHQDLRFRTRCHLVYFLPHINATFSTRSLRRGASEEGGVMSVENPNGSANCSSCRWTT